MCQNFYQYSREAFIRKKRKYICLLWGPSPFKQIGNFRFFPRLFSFFFWNFKNDNLRAMKQILYDTANQATVNRAVHSKGKREKGLCMNIWISQQQNEAYCSPIQ